VCHCSLLGSHAADSGTAPGCKSGKTIRGLEASYDFGRGRQNCRAPRAPMTQATPLNGLRKTHLFCKSAYRPFKVIDFTRNRKRVCNFLLVRHSNLGLILLRFRNMAGFLLRNGPPTQPYSTRILRVFTLDQIAHIGVA